MHISPTRAQPQVRNGVVIAANFVADHVRESLEFWFHKMDLNGGLQFAPFDQIIQQLLDPAGVLRAEATYDVIFIQVERWLPDKKVFDRSERLRLFEDFADALAAAAQSGPTAFMVVICPASPLLKTHEAIEAAEGLLRTRIAEIPGVDLVTSKELQELYPVENYDSQFDPHANQLAQIPYTRLCFATLGTVVARWFYRLHTKARKVIVLDCDNTLWSGLCGEDGPARVFIGPERQALQQFLIKQTQVGRVLCLCSKNEEQNVFEVFDRHATMILKREHLVAWRINWEPKPDNLRRLSEELSLGLDSFVFIDDDSSLNARRCAPLCPEVLTLQLPSDETQIGSFLRNVWDLDQRTATEEDQNRTLYYRQNAERNRAKKTTSSLKDFLASLELEVQITPLAPEDFFRASQLTERTNQFNLNGFHCSVADLKRLIDTPNTCCMLVRARDRFGDYGSVGL